MAENNLDIRNELLKSALMPSDFEAREYIRNFNLELRNHLENFPKHFNNPWRIPGQGGRLRKPMQVEKTKVIWFDCDP